MGTSSHPVPLAPAAACQNPFFSMPASGVPVHAWRVIRWETDVPLGDDETELLPEMLQNVFSMAGLCACSVPPEADHVVMLLAHTAFPAPVHADLATWLCVYQLMDTFLNRLGKEGTVQISRAFQDRAAWESQELLPLAAAFVPVAAEAVWNQFPDFSVQQLTEGLSLNLLTRRPREALSEWISSLSSLLSEPSASPSGPDIRRVQDLILQNPSLPYTQERLAHSLGLSPTYFCRLFHAQTGQTFSAFLSSARIRMAKELLLEGSHTIQEVAEMCGYPNKSYFCKVFRKHAHVSPGAYAVAHAADDPSLS